MAEPPRPKRNMDSVFTVYIPHHKGGKGTDSNFFFLLNVKFWKYLIVNGVA